MNEETQQPVIDRDSPEVGAVGLAEGPLSTAGVIKNVAKYFMTFLETDFMKRRLPKRNTNNFAVKGNRVGYELERYPELKKFILRNFGKTTDELKVTIKAGQYVSKMPRTLLTFINERIDEIDSTAISSIIESYTNDYKEAKKEHIDNYENFLAELKDDVRSSIDANLVASLIEDVRKPLIQAGVSQQSGVFRLQSEIREHVFSLLEESIEKYAPKFFASKEPKAVITELEGDCKEILTVEVIKDLLSKDFEEFATHDCYKDLYQLSRSLQLLDKTELYLYLFDLEINLENRDSFPLFYVPIRLDHSESEYTLTFDNRVFVNSKAFEFVCQEFAEKTKSPVTPDKFDRIIYGESENSLRDKLEHILRRVVQTLDLDEQVDLATTAIKVSSNAHVSLSNALSLYVFDKSDEALINDYEEILNDDGELSELFAELLQSFLSQNPLRLDEEVDVDWDSLGIPEKLLTESPIPLNEEQKKVVMALGKDDCKVLILEGPPGTGKSHTITSVICKAVLEGQSVLVLSDKKEALDVVEDKISSTLNKVRTDESFQNPILRLGAMGRGIGKVVDGTVLGSIKHHYSTYRKNENVIDTQYKELTEQTKKQLDANTGYFADLSIPDLQKYFELGKEYEQFGTLFEGFPKPLGEDRINKLLDGINNLREAEAKQEGFINLAKVFPGSESLTALQHGLTDFEKTTSKSDEVVVGATERILNEGLATPEDLKKLIKQVKGLMESASGDLGDAVIALEKDQKLGDLPYQLEFTNGVVKVGARIYEYLAPNKNRSLAALYSSVVGDVMNQSKVALQELSSYITSVQSLKSILGFAGKRGQIDTLTLNLRKTIPSFQLDNPEKRISDLVALKATLEFATSLVAESYDNDDAILSHALSFCDYLVTDYRHLESANAIAEDVSSLVKLYSKTNSLFDELEWRHCDSIQEAVELKNQQQTLIAMANKQVSFLDVLLPGTSGISMNIGTISEALNLYEKQSPKALEKAVSEIEFINGLTKPEKHLLEQIGLSLSLANIAECQHAVLDLSAQQRNELYSYINKQEELNKLFNEAPEDAYLEEQSEIEYFNTAKMAYMLDKHIIDYTTNKSAELQTLRGLIKKKQQFPQTLFDNLKQAFPCILAGIRDYAEYIPLQKDLFDLIIIDEASQVSIAQALPAFIRGKKILILGDDKQFSNVKAGNASNERNQYFRHELIDVFRKDNVGLQDISIFEHKIRENFDVKRSVLDFTRFISNYVIQLKKHFRCYPEIISYSNKNFYNGTLECVKLRSVPISEVIKFDVLEHDGRVEKYAKTNTLEAEFILTVLQSWHDKGEKKTVGVITPHSEQARIVAETLQASEIWNWLEKECSIKIMTFDTCQGEERDYIFYSMVANPSSDRLSWIFAADFSNSQDYEQRLNAQRMNVGFSRAKNTVHFVLSKPVSEFKGEIQKALKHYEDELRTAKDIHLGDTDENSPMEKKVQEWLYQTKFYQDHKELEVKPQFPIGQYLKYIDPDYNHPNYKVDFLLVLDNNTIILEYDGFKEHFDSLSEVDATNYRSYQKPNDYYRQKVLESYGYRFMRVNKFNLGDDPVASLDEMLTEKFKKKTSHHLSSVN